MSMDPATFQTIHPSRYITFTFPNPIPSHSHFSTPLLRVAVLDSSPSSSTTICQVAAMMVPPGRESDWTFDTEAGHHQLLLCASTPHLLSRLILIGSLPTSRHSTSTYNRPPDPINFQDFQEKITPLLFALCPRSCFQRGRPEVPFLNYEEDDLIRGVIVHRCVGSNVGEMLVEDIELEGQNGNEFRRRLRFKRMPNLIQTQMRILPKTAQQTVNDKVVVGLGKAEFELEKEVLVHPYLAPMVAALSIIGGYLDEKIRGGFRPKALCLGVGGGALLSFLNAQLSFDVIGVEADSVVLSVARKYFGLEDSPFVKVCIGDAIEFVQRLAHRDKNKNDESNGCLSDVVDGIDYKFDVIMVDLDSTDAKLGMSAPPLEFVKSSVLCSARQILCDLGILVINVIPPSRSFYERLIHEFEEVFQVLYEIDVGNGENYVLIAAAAAAAAATPISSVATSTRSKDSFFGNLEKAISGAYLDCIKKISNH